MSPTSRAVRRTPPRPYLAWQLSTLALTAIFGIAVALGYSGSCGAASTVVGMSLMVIPTVAISVVPWHRIAHAWQALVPLLAVVAVLLMALDTVSRMPSVLLIAVLAVLWLVFDFDWIGTALAVLSAVALVGVAYLGEASLPSSWPVRLQLAMVLAVGLGLGIAVRQVGVRLRWRRRVLEEQSALHESTLELAHDRLLVVQAVLDSVDAGIVSYDRDGNLVLENSLAHEHAARAGVRLSGAGEARQTQLYLEDRVTPVPDDLRVVPRAQRGEEVPPRTYWIGPPEDQVAVRLGARQIHRANGDRFGTVVVGWDVTDAVEAVRVREEFLTTVSHELRTPLTSIIGYQELIAEELGPEDQRVSHMLSVAQRNAHVLLSRVSQLLQASGAEGPGMRARPVDVSSLVLDALAKQGAVAAAAGIRLTTAVAPGVRGHLDPDAWEQVVDNLVSNALKYTPAGGAVEVGLEGRDDAFVLRVADTGIGMSGAELDRVFERFYRTTAAHERAIQGLGIGLSIAQQIIEAHGGEVDLSSVPGRGTTATVQVPLRPVRATADVAPGLRTPGGRA
ncbi:HAMP domain-containing histidine kinase [Nocardioides sp. cx-169]|uniref:sensor histidine kinase n=1 Tax=Nocardioides sp. cx-169 TaxID=2899080 RepID=UPI001E28323B|nr:HAMP domain-containing sensor histidine kinase [Nocardioides sp. cx-169]MCD4536524.1 HAMP domain-containing histidine kinase [Nocardioides sp. cx-169]